MATKTDAAAILNVLRGSIVQPAEPSPAHEAALVAAVKIVVLAVAAGAPERETIWSVTRAANHVLVGDQADWFVCDRCGYAGETSPESDVAARAEHRAVFGFEAPGPEDEDGALLCEDCWIDFITFAQEQGIVQGAAVN